MSTLVSDIYWQCQNQWHAKLFHSRTIHWTDLSKEPTAELVKENNKRKVYRLVLGDATLYVKVYVVDTVIERLKNLFRDMPAKEEFTKLFIAHQRNVSVSVPIAWGKNNIGSRGYLVSLAVESSVTLQDILLDKTNRAFMDQALLLTAKLVAASHCGGVIHKDLHSGNVLISVETDTAVLIDIRGASVTHRSGHASADPYADNRITNMGFLIADIRHNISNAQLRSFTQNYLDSLNLINPLNVIDKENYFNSVSIFADKRDHFLWKKRAKRAKRNSDFARHFKLHGQWNCSATLKSSFVNHNYTATGHTFTNNDFKRAFVQPETICDEGETLYENDHIHEVLKQIKINDVLLDLSITKYKPSVGFKRLFQLFRKSAAKKIWLSATNLHRRRIPTSWPICAIEKRSFVFVKESIMISERIKSSKTVSAFLSNPLCFDRSHQRHQFFRQLGTMLGTFRYRKMVHHDCNACNIMVHADNSGEYHFVFQDLRSVISMSYFNSKYRHKALVGLMTSFLSYGETISSTDIFRFIKAYLVASGDFKCNEGVTVKAFVVDLRQQIPAFAKQLHMATQHRLQFSTNSNNDSLAGFKNILIIKPSALGDVVRCIPLLNALKNRYPDAKISWLVRTDCATILRGLTNLDEIIEFDRKLFSRLGRNFVATKRFFSFVKRLRKNQYDLVLDFQGLFRSGFFSWVTGAPIKVGFNNAREFATCFYTHKVVEHDNEHIVDTMWRFGYLLNFVSYKKDFSIEFTTESILQAEKCLEDNELKPNQYIVLLIGGTAAAKRWPVEMFATLARRLSDEVNTPIVLIGAGDTEVALATTFMSRVKGALSTNRFVNLVNQTSIPQAALIMKQSLLVCGNDSGPLHIADSFDVPLVSIYGPTNPDVVGPYRHMNMVVVAGQNIAREQRYSLDEVHKIVNITVDDVYNGIMNQLGKLPEKTDD